MKPGEVFAQNIAIVNTLDMSSTTDSKCSTTKRNQNILYADITVVVVKQQSLKISINEPSPEHQDVYSCTKKTSAQDEQI